MKLFIDICVKTWAAFSAVFALAILIKIYQVGQVYFYEPSRFILISEIVIVPVIILISLCSIIFQVIHYIKKGNKNAQS